MDSKLKICKDMQTELEMISRATSLDYRYVKRAKIILYLAKGKTYSSIRSSMGVGRNTVSRWKKRFLKSGIKGLKDIEGRGRKPLISPDVKNRVINLACSKPEGVYSSRSQRRIAEETGISVFAVNKILKENELKPHKVEQWCGKSTDPEFESKMLNIVGLYLNPPENAIVLSVDEKTQIQAIDRRQPELPLAPGKSRRQTATYVRHGTVALIAALAVHHGEVTAKTIDHNNGANFLKFLKLLDRKYRNKTMHIIIDNLSVHNSKEVKAYLKPKRKFKLHFTPTYSSWLNQIEIWFSIMSRDVLKGGIWNSREQLVNQLIDYIDIYNKTRAKPFTWTYDGTKRPVNISIKDKERNGIDILKTQH